MRSVSRDGQTFTEEARRRQFVQYAIEALSESGHATASLGNIAARAGVSKSVIAYHFGTKDALFEEVTKAVFAAATDHLTPRLAAASTMPERLAAYIEGRVRFLETHRAHMLALFEIWTNQRNPDGTLRFGEGDATETVDAIVGMLRAGQEAGEFGDFDAEVMAMAIRQTIDGVLLAVRAEPDLNLPRYAAELVALFDRATRPARPADRGSEGDEG